MISISDPTLHMWFVLALTGWALISFIREKISIEVTSVILLTALLVFGQLFPLEDANGRNMLAAGPLLQGFANPALVAVLALLVMGQGMVHTDAIRAVTNLFSVQGRSAAFAAIAAIMVFVMVFSAFMNNTPLVVLAIPVVQSLVARVGMSVSRYLIPLSYVAILGGMTTLIGSSTNLLVSSAMVELGYESLRFFDFIVPGSMMAAAGFIYVLLIAPFTLTDRSTLAGEITGSQKEFVAELDVGADSKLVGVTCEKGVFEGLGGLNLRMIQRRGQILLPPFEGYTIEVGDVLIVSAPRKELVETLSTYPGFFLAEQLEENKPSLENSEKDTESVKSSAAGTRIMAELMVTPASRMIDVMLDNADMQRRYGLIILGIQRRARVVRRRIGKIRLEAGDTLLVAGPYEAVESLRENDDFIVLSGSKRELPVRKKAPLAGAIFVATIASAAFGLISIPVAAIAGSVLMIGTGCLNIRQAMRAMDRTIFLLVGAMLALGVAMQATGGARFIAGLMRDVPYAHDPLVMAAVLFIMVAVFTNLLSNNACAILFTPIAMNLAGTVEVPPDLQYDIAFVYAVTVVFAANCSFASPIGYKTNLLVMGPGHYRFVDFAKAGLPLMILMWVMFIGIAKFYYGL